MTKQKTHLYIIVLSLILAVTAGCRENSSDSQIYCSELRSVNKLILAKMSLSKMATIDDITLSEARGIKQTASALLAAIKPGTRKAAYSYNTYLCAYINLSQLDNNDVRLSDDGEKLTITLPPIKVEFLGRDNGIKEEHYRVTGLRSEINADERAALKEEMNTVIKEEIRTNPDFTDHLIDTARNKATAYFSSWGKIHGVEVEVKFAN